MSAVGEYGAPQKLKEIVFCPHPAAFLQMRAQAFGFDDRLFSHMVIIHAAARLAFGSGIYYS